MKTLPSLLAVILVVSACESNEKKLARLESEKVTQCLVEQATYRQYNEARFPGGMTRENIKTAPTAAASSLGSKWSEARAKCELATRAYDGFMR